MQEFEIEFKTEDIFEIDISDKIAEVAPPLIDLEVVSTNEIKVYEHEGEYGYDKVTVLPVSLQDKSVTPSKEQQTVNADEGYTGLNQVIVVGANLQDKNVTPNEERQIVKADEGYYGLNEVTIEPIPQDDENSGITDCKYLFYQNARIGEVNNILKLCKKATTLEYMFAYSKITELVMENFDFSEVTTMYNMFNSCSNLINLKIVANQTPKLKAINYFLYGASNVQNVDLDQFDMSNVEDIDRMFYSANNLTDLKFGNNFGKGFTKTRNNYATYKVDLKNQSNLTHESLMSVINKLYDLNLTYNVAGGGTLYTQQLVLGSTNLAKLNAEEINIAVSKGWSVS